MTESSSPSVAHEDLTDGDDLPPSLPPVAADAPEKRVWQRWVVNDKTKVRTQETYELLPYLRSVEDLWHRLCEGDAPLRGATDNVDAWAGAAIKLLYLLSHQPWQYRHLRSTPEVFIEQIEAWGNENVPREKTLEAVTLAFAIHNEAHPETDGDAPAAAAV